MVQYWENIVFLTRTIVVSDTLILLSQVDVSKLKSYWFVKLSSTLCPLTLVWFSLAMTLAACPRLLFSYIPIHKNHRHTSQRTKDGDYRHADSSGRRTWDLRRLFLGRCPGGAGQGQVSRRRMSTVAWQPTLPRP